MTNEVYIVTNSVVTSLDVLKSVNDMYSSEFTRLLTVMGLLVGLVGAAVIVLPLWFQVREAKVRRAEMEAQVNKHLEQLDKSLSDRLQKMFREEKKSIDEAIEGVKGDYKKGYSQLVALGAHTQMEIAYKEGKYVHAAESATVAIRANCKCNDHSNVIRELRSLLDLICPKLKKEDLEKRDLSQKLGKMEEELKEANKTGFLNDQLAELKHKKSEILKNQ
jgi:hypothetical protein